MKDWILYNRGLIPWAISLVVLCVGTVLVNERINKKNPEYLKVRELCTDTARKIEGIELDVEEAKLVPIGVRAKQASYSGLMMVWEKETSGISVKCSVISNGNRVKYFAVNGEDKTKLVGREERKK